ncbi:flagellar hook capping FlgD N-terminal domain-containing protein [Marivivens donghaensis]|jgi:flagellar basal-body rod modification protein FlgD|uniref:flagellar hook capping FlgD N-terminal domain-containing protein n=1 Tax=Marivivens donghaensis TaxID=1699413 RepID=UPI003F6A4DAA
MDVTATTSTTTTTAPTSSSAISSDFETFLNMLTVQMQNQDPLNPTDPSDYAVQLATFSSVEQQVKTNDLLAQLMAVMSSSAMSDMGAWIGQDVRAPTSAHFDGTPISVTTSVDVDADSADLVVVNSYGAEVQRIAIDPTSGTVTWAGVDDYGSAMTSGDYGFYVESYQSDALIATTQASVYGTVAEVRTESGATVLVLENGAEVPVETVTALRAR